MIENMEENRMECECCHNGFNVDELSELEFNNDRLCSDCRVYAEEILKKIQN